MNIIYYKTIFINKILFLNYYLENFIKNNK